MTYPHPSNDTIAPIPGQAHDQPGVEFGTSADGFPVARIGDTTLAMVPTADGRENFLASAWRLTRPLADLKRRDFHGHEGRLDNEAAFRARVVETARHKAELANLSREQVRMSCSTPWGASQHATIYADGIVFHATSGHGGFHLSAARNDKVLEVLRNASGWYEEDTEWAIVALIFPDVFTTYERSCADETLRNAWPSEWERIHGRRLEPGESWSKDKAVFERTHVHDWVVASAITSTHHAGMVEVVARRSRASTAQDEERRFLVPSSEYDTRGRFGFVIDGQRHAIYDGPSNFLGWPRRKTLS
ncbi:DUF7007 domain-containing protein [Pararhizobium antarcticum]|uniref:DUF7007 domain-containing protein n=1 Tax=Pararhizobium antarcticum TaxID=1798805 RepID=UPI0009FA14B9|nr:hypothetical protein [Pararhizobium antarcticum]